MPRSLPFASLLLSALLLASPAAGQPTDLVTTQGREFVRNGQVYRFVGVNMRGLVHYGQPQPLPYTSTADIDYNLDGVAAFHGTVIRVFAANGNYNNATNIANLQAVLDKMEARGQKAIVCLTDVYTTAYHPQGDDGYYQLQPGGWTLLDDTWFTSGYTANYLPWVQDVVNQLKNHNAVFAWEIGNELTDIKVPANIIPFTLATAQAIKAIDAYHMVTTGFIGIDHTQIGEAAGKALYESPYLDFMTVHSYDGSDPGQNWATHARVEKPLVLEEYGWQTPAGDRVTNTTAQLAKWFDVRGARGFMHWGYQYNTTDIGDGDGMFGLDRNFFASDYNALTALYQGRADSYSSSPPPLPTLGLPAGTNVALSSVAFASDSNFSGAYGPEKAFDGVVSGASKWTSTGSAPPHWIAADLGATRAITGFVVKSAGEAMELVSYGFESYQVQTGTSLSGPWTTVHTVSNPNQYTVSKSFNGSTINARYIRLYVTDCGIDSYARLPEFEIYALGSSVEEWQAY